MSEQKNKLTKKVLYVSHMAEQKGSGMSLYHLMRHVGSASAQHVYQPLALFGKTGPMLDQVRADGVPAWFAERRPGLNVGLIYRAWKLIRDERPDLVHLNSATPYSRYVSIAARLAGVPILWHIREDPQGKRVSRLRSWIGRVSARVIAVSGEIEDCFKASGKAVRIYNGVDLAVFTPQLDGAPFRQRIGASDDEVVFGLVGTIEPRKGQLEFLHAMARLGASFPWRIALIGDGLPEHTAAVQRFLDQHPELAARTVLTGRMSGVEHAIAGLDMLVMPSTWEGFPRVLIEAMACGRPVIATPVGETPWMFEDGSEGWLTPVGDQAALVNALRQAGELGRDGLRRMGEKAHLRAQRYSIAAHVAAVTQLYDEVLAGLPG